MAAKLKSIVRFTSHYKILNFTGAPEKDGEFKSSLTLFDANGNLKEEVKYSPEGAVEERIVNIYDSQNKLIEESIHFVLDEAFEKRLIKRNEKGFAVEEEKIYTDGTSERTIYNLDANNNISEVIRYNEDNTIDVRVNLIYDDKNRLVEEKKIDGQDQVLEHRIQSYDAKGNLTEVTEYSPEEKVAYRTVHDYNEAGKNSSSSYYDATNKLIVKSTSLYDERGNLTERFVEDLNSSLGKKTMKFEYDEHGNCTEEATYAANGALISRLSTRFDEIGNPVEEINFAADMTHGGRDEYFGNRYEYEFYE